MENQNQQKTGNTPAPFHKTQHARLGPILGMIILILALVLGGLFLWGSMLANKEAGQPLPPIVNNEPETPRAAADTQILETTSSSDELSAIEADIESTNLDLIEQDLQAISNEFDGSVDEEYEVQ